MNKLVHSLLTLTTLSVGASAYGQGLLSLRPDKDEFERRLPFTVTVDVGAGYDSNVNLSPSDEQDSAYINAGVGVQWRGGDRRTSYDVSANYGGFYYLDPPAGTDEYLNSARIGFNLRHKVNPKMTISNSLYAAYEFEPNYAIGAGTTRRTQEYFYGYNDLNVSYAWGRKISTVTGYTITGIDYQEDSFEGESFLNHIFHNEIRYAFAKLTSAVFDYRYSLAEYDNGFGDYTSHYFLAGLDHNFTRRTFGAFRAGAEIRDRDNGGSSSNPYFEGNLSYRADKDTTLNVYARYGFEDTSIGGFQERTSFRTGLTAQRRLTDRLNTTAGLHYIHDEFSDSSIDGDSNYDEDTFAASIGFDYSLYKNVSLTTSYSFTTSSSGNELREYDRHNVSLGLRASF
jgi:hypothetical protein